MTGSCVCDQGARPVPARMWARGAVGVFRLQRPRERGRGGPSAGAIDPSRPGEICYRDARCRRPRPSTDAHPENRGHSCGEGTGMSRRWRYAAIGGALSIGRASGTARPSRAEHRALARARLDVGRAERRSADLDLPLRVHVGGVLRVRPVAGAAATGWSTRPHRRDDRARQPPAVQAPPDHGARPRAAAPRAGGLPGVGSRWTQGHQRQ